MFDGTAQLSLPISSGLGSGIRLEQLDSHRNLLLCNRDEPSLRPRPVVAHPLNVAFVPIQWSCSFDIHGSDIPSKCAK